jgi:RHS repeat-associated protein
VVSKKSHALIGYDPNGPWTLCLEAFMSRARLVPFLLILFLIALFVPASQGQITQINDTTSVPIEGAGHDYVHLLSETVNPANGSVSINLQLPMPKGRGLTVPFAFAYNSNGLNHIIPSTTNPGRASWVSNTDLFASAGWSYVFPSLRFDNWTSTVYVISGYNDGTPIYTGYPCNYYSNYLFSDGTGGIHSLGLGTVFPEPTPPPGGCPGSPAPSGAGGDADVYAILQPDPGEAFYSVPVSVNDKAGTVYYFASLSAAGSDGNASLFSGPPTYIEDRNGNKVTTTLNGSALTFTDTLGRSAVSTNGFGPSGTTNTVSAGGLSYQVTWTTVSVNYSVPNTNIQNLGGECVWAGGVSTSYTVISQITLPNGQSFHFYYGTGPTIQNPWGLLSEIDYPDGGSVKYTWNLSGNYNELAVYPGGEPNGQPNGVSPVTDGCIYQYQTPVITSRQVYYGGSTAPALTQSFSYATQWASGNGSWSTKTTELTATDNVSSLVAQTNYCYSSLVQPSQPFGYTNYPAQLPVEYLTVYGATGSPSCTPPGTGVRSTVKTWYDQFDLKGQQTVLLDVSPNLTSQTTYCYVGSNCVPNGTLSQIQEVDEYDFGASSPTRSTVTNYQAFTGTPGVIADAPCQTITYAGTPSGTRAAETDSYYDGSTALCGVISSGAATGGPSGFTGRDDTTFGPNSTVPRGNLTKVSKLCIQSAPACSSGPSTTTSTYDETGQVVSITDPCGNTSCSDMTGTNHITSYSYADSYTTLSAGQNSSYIPSVSTNAYLTKITDPLGHTEKFTYDFNNGQLTILTDQNNQPTSFLYNDLFNRPTRINYPDGGLTTIAYNDSPYNPSTPSPSVTTTKLISSGTNLVIVAASDGLGHAVETLLTSDPNCSSGDRTDTTYDGTGHVHTVSNPYCSTSDSTYGLTSYAYDAIGRLTSVTHPDGSSALKTHLGRATEVQDEGNGTQSVIHISQVDGLGRLASVCEVASGPFVGTGGSSTSSLIGSGGAPSSSCGQDIPGPGFLTDYLHDILGNLTQVNQPGVSARGFAYDSLSRLTSATNPESGTVSYSYDANGNLSTKTDARGTVTTFGYDNDNRLLTKFYSDSTPGVTNTYDTSSVDGFTLLYPVGRLVKTKTNDGLTASVNSYDPMGRTKNQWQCTPQNCGTAYFSLPYGYDFAGDITSAGNGMNVTLTYGPFNGAGELPAVTSSLSDANHPANLLSGATYTPFAAIATEQLGNGVTESRAYNKRLWLQSLSAANPAGGTATPGTGTVTVSGSEQSKQVLTQPATAGTGTVTISGSERTAQKCTQHLAGGDCGRYITVYDSGTVSVTVNGHPESVTYQSGSSSSTIASALASAFNGDSGSSVTAVASGSLVTLTSKTTGSATNYSLSATSSTSDPTDFGYPSFSPSPSGSALTGGSNAVYTTVYDTGTATITVNGFPASYTYGQNDTAASIAAGLASALSPSSVSASSSGGTVTLTAKTTGSGTNYSLSASSSSSNGFSPSSFTASPSGANLTGGTNDSIYSLALSSYAPNGDVLAASDSANGNWTYTYDPFNRVVGANQNNGQSVYNYVYDIAGNRWQQNGQYSMIATFTGNNTTNNNRIDGRSYDAAGNLLNDGIHNYTFDAENRLTQVDSGATATYIYDAGGRRVRKTVGGVSVDYLYDLSDHEITEVNSSGGWNRGEVYAGDSHLATYNDGTTYFIHRDWIGTERVRSNVSGVSCETITSLPFGDGMTTTGSCSDASPMHFTGKQRDTETGLDNFGARYDSSNLGRFMSPDPGNVGADTRDPRSWNAYSYTGNNPLNRIDPAGLDYSVCVDDGQGGQSCTYYANDKDFQNTMKDPGAGIAFLGDENGGNIYGTDADGNLVQVGTYQHFFGPGDAAAEGLEYEPGTDMVIASPFAGLFGSLFGGASAGAASGVWSLGNFVRGDIIEQMLGGNLPRTFPVIDAFEDGVATSIKSIDLTAGTYQAPDALASKLTGYVDKLAGFQGATLGDIEVKAGEVTSKVLKIAIPDGGMSAAQQGVINRVAAQAAQQGVKVVVVSVR